MKQYAIYLRKSRVDLEAEARGEGDTLARHKKILLELAEKLHLHIGRIYQEIVSGDSIAGRPEMQNLLDDVQRGLWAGVLVVEVERLARGDTSDQGLVAKAFKYSGTKIITPIKTYDPADEFDEEYFEFSLFMSRREYKVINRRLQRGRIASAKDGNYIGGQVPYGYERIRDAIGPTLRPVEKEAEIVRWIFDQYCNSDATACAIASRLNHMGIPTKKGSLWRQETIRGILLNPVYIGKIRWKHRVNIKSVDPTAIHRRYGDAGEAIVCDGRHEPIISVDLFNRAGKIIKDRYKWPVNDRRTINNPVAAIAKCGICGHTLIRGIRRGRPFLCCTAPGCKNKSIDMEMFEKYMLESVSAWLENYRISLNGDAAQKNSASKLSPMADRIKKEIQTLEKQRSSLHDLLEQGVYTPDMFRERYSGISDRISAAQDELVRISDDIARGEERQRKEQTIIPQFSRILTQYNSLTTAAEKNQLLRTCIEKIVYIRDKDSISLDVFPILPNN